MIKSDDFFLQASTKSELFGHKIIHCKLPIMQAQVKAYIHFIPIYLGFITFAPKLYSQTILIHPSLKKSFYIPSTSKNISRDILFFSKSKNE